MKKLLIFVLTVTSLPLGALNAPSPDQEPVATVYSADRAQNARQAVRLGNKLFQLRVNTSQMTSADMQIASLIDSGFRPFFDKLNQLENAPKHQVKQLQSQYSDEFESLVVQLTQALLKNQKRYNHTLLLDEKAALEETLLIVQEAVDRGHF